MNATSAQTKSLEWLNRLRANPKIPLIVAGSAGGPRSLILAGESPRLPHIIQQSFRSGWWRNRQPTTQMNIPYRFSEASGAIEVPADKVHELRLCSAQQGLPGCAVGFQPLDQESLVSASSANR